jgi:arsenite methyltransferase
VNGSERDMWAAWLLERRFGGATADMERAMTFLRPVRDKVLGNARLGDGEVLLDVGCGDGLIAFGALDRAPNYRVIFSDVSRDLLDVCEEIAGEMGVLERCRFLEASAEDLSALENGSVDVVTTRSVLIYVQRKQQAFHEIYRVLKPGGRLSIFEPINRFGYPAPDHLFMGYDVTPVLELAQKVKAVYEGLQPAESDPMLDFDERELLSFAERAGFLEIQLELQAVIKPYSGAEADSRDVDWDTRYRCAPNPYAPTLEEAIDEALTEAEAQRFINHLRPLVDSHQGGYRFARAFLWAVK